MQKNRLRVLYRLLVHISFFIVEYFLAYSYTHTHTVLSLPILLTMDTEAVFMSWLLEIMLSEHGGSDFSLEKWFLYLWINTQELGLLSHMLLKFLIFWGSSILFSIGSAPVHISTNKGSFLFNLAPVCYLLSFWWQSFEQVWSDISLWFWLAFPWWLVIMSIFSYTCWPSISSLEKFVFRSFP